MLRNTVPLMTDKGGRSRPGQKYFALGKAREPFEAWCRENAYDERVVMLAGWLALLRLNHEQRKQLFRDVDGAEQAGFPANEGRGEKPSTASVSPRPAEKTPSQGSRRAG